MIDDEVRRLQSAFRSGTGPGLMVRNEYAPLLKSLAQRPKPLNAESTGASPRIVRMLVATGCVRLPELDERVLDVLAITVVDEALDPDALADGLGGGDHVSPSAPIRIVKYGPTVCDGVGPRLHRPRSQRRGVASPQHDVPAIGERPVGVGLTPARSW